MDAAADIFWRRWSRRLEEHEWGCHTNRMKMLEADASNAVFNPIVTPDTRIGSSAQIIISAREGENTLGAEVGTRS
jgi:hypothetical protein